MTALTRSRKRPRPIVRGFYQWRAAFPKSSFNLPLVHATLVKRASRHDVLTLEYVGRVVKVNNHLRIGDPVTFTYGTRKAKKTWHGYVHHVSPTTTNSRAYTRVVCIGASWVLKTTEQKIYKKMTADRAVAKIARASGLQPDTQRHPRVFKTISNTGQTQWQLLRRLAEQTGFALTTEGMVVRFKSKDTIYRESLAKRLYFRYHDEKVPALSVYNSIFYFKPTFIESAPEFSGSDNDVVVSGVSDQTGKVLVTKHKNPKGSKKKKKRFSKHQVFDVSSSLTDAKSVAAGKTERFKYRASATLLGNMKVELYNAVYLDGLTGGFNGHWIVLGVSHVFGEGVPYVMDVQLGCDELGTVEFQPDPTEQNGGSDDGQRDTAGEINGSTTTAASPEVSLLDLTFSSELSQSSGTTSNNYLENGPDANPDFGIIGSDLQWVAELTPTEELSASEYNDLGYKDTSGAGASPESQVPVGSTVLLDMPGIHKVPSPQVFNLGDASGYDFIYAQGWLYVPEASPYIRVSFGQAVTPYYLIEAKNCWVFFHQQIDPADWPQELGVNNLYIEAIAPTTEEFYFKNLLVTGDVTADE